MPSKIRKEIGQPNSGVMTFYQQVKVSLSLPDFVKSLCKEKSYLTLALTPYQGKKVFQFEVSDDLSTL